MKALAKLNTLYTRVLWVLIAFSSLLNTGNAVAGMDTSVPVSAELATNVAKDMFPVTVNLSETRLFLTDPTMLFLDDKRIGIQVRFQAYDHRPDKNIAISELGRARISGELGYDLATRQILLHAPGVDRIEFDRDNHATNDLLTELKAAWSAQVTNPIRSELPPHPYLIPFKENIRDLSYDGKRINIVISYS